MTPGIIALIVTLSVIAFIAICIFIGSIRIVRQTEEYIVERFGAYVKTWGVGIHMLIPFIERVAKRVSMKEQIYDFPPQPVITKDNVTIQIDTIVFFQVTDSKLYSYGVENPIMGIESLTATTLRNIIGELDLDQTLTSRDIINSKMRSVLDEATDPWGIKVTRVELKNILPPRDIQEAMERQMRAEREKREKILLAEGQKTAAITIAEGNKQAAILNAEADKEARIRIAEAEAESIWKIQEAKAAGELAVREAEAEGIRKIKEAAPDTAVLTIKGYEALAKVAEGQATKILLPNNLASIGSLVAGAAEILRDEKKSK